MQEFSTRVAVVTGAASGIGYAIAQKCLAEGMRVVIADIDAQELDRAAARLAGDEPGTVLAVPTDVALEAQLEHLADTAFAHFGAVHLLFNNAGVGGRGNTLTATKKDWEWVIGVNLMSVINAVRIFAPRMIAQNEPGHIVNTASVAGLIGGVNPGYALTKHAVVALTESLYADLKQASACVGASVLCPGLINTNIMNSERHRPGYASDAASVAARPSDEILAKQEIFRVALANGMAPAQVAEIAFDGIRDGRLYILTHAEFNERIVNRANNIAAGVNPEVDLYSLG